MIGDACFRRARWGDLAPPLRNRWFADSPLEGTGFELPVPRPIGNNFEALSETGPRRNETAGKIARRVGASDLKRVLSPVAAAEVIPTEARQAFEHAGGTADRKIALLTQGYGVIRVLRPI